MNIETTAAGKTAKRVLTLSEAAKYMGVSKSWLYKLTSNRAIPYYKPSGKLLYFSLDELEQWLLSNRVATQDEISSKAQSYCLGKGDKK